MLGSERVFIKRIGDGTCAAVESSVHLGAHDRVLTPYSTPLASLRAASVAVFPMHIALVAYADALLTIGRAGSGRGGDSGVVLDSSVWWNERERDITPSCPPPLPCSSSGRFWRMRKGKLFD